MNLECRLDASLPLLEAPHSGVMEPTVILMTAAGEDLSGAAGVIPLAGAHTGAGFGEVQGLIQLPVAPGARPGAADGGLQLTGAGLGRVVPFMEPAQGPGVFTALPGNLLLQPAPLVHHQVAPPPKGKCKRRKKSPAPKRRRDPNSFHEKYRRLMAKMEEEAEMAPPGAEEGKCTQPCAGYGGDAGYSLCDPGAHDQNGQGPFYGGYYDNGVSEAAATDLVCGDPQQWPAGPALPCPDTWLAVSPPPLMSGWVAVEPPGGLEAALELLFPDQPDPETERQEQLLSTYAPISDNVGRHGYPELLVGEDSKYGGDAAGLDDLTLLDWAFLTHMFPGHTPLDTRLDTHTQLWNPGNDGSYSNALHHNAWACHQNADAVYATSAASIGPIRSESLQLRVDPDVGHTMCAEVEGCSTNQLEGGGTWHNNLRHIWKLSGQCEAV
ncbi:uncharacterized protein LOC121696121 [Alosa sapidissima]|uniref:uncharacterized protein LOC121696121 n=1 Tax=Alosa sapidissima TaxID=34773 RepID=UPI001C0886F2|nr:uncharacterized protein LOC121696121 [Alosa sapidissima]